MFQTFNLIPTLSAQENVETALVPLGIEILVLLEKFWREYGLTLIVVTHDSVVARRAQRIGVMRNGRLTFKQSANRARVPSTAVPAPPPEAIP